jgi:hypothetical protein
VSKHNRAASHTARLRLEQEAGVGAGPESHGWGVDCFVGVGVRRDIVKETMGRGQVVLSGGGLMGGELADCCEEGEVQCPRIEEQGPNYLLNPCLFCGGDWGRRGGGRWG